MMYTDSLNMNNLASSLPSSTIAKAEQETMDKFKVAAQSLTLLYRSSQKAAKRHFDAGYATALEDLLSVIQHGVSVGHDPDGSENDGNEGISIGRILDWIEARQESIRLKAREEEEEEEEREVKAKTSGKAKLPVSVSEPGDSRDKVMPRSTRNGPSSPTISTKRLSGKQASEQSGPASTHVSELSLSASLLSAPATQHFPSSQSLSTRPQTRARVRSQQVLSPLNTSSVNSSTATSNSGSSMASLLGAKRRHAAMLLDGYPPSPTAVSLPPSELRGTSTPISLLGTSPQHSDGLGFSGAVPSIPLSNQRRRIRNSRANLVPRSESATVTEGHGLNVGEILMDIEDDGGRERKRVARR